MQNEHSHSVLPSEKIMENKPTYVIMRHLIIKSLEGLTVKGVTMGLKRNHRKGSKTILFSAALIWMDVLGILHVGKFLELENLEGSPLDEGDACWQGFPV